MLNIKYCILDALQKNSSYLLVPTVPVSRAMVKPLVHIASTKLSFMKGNQIIFQHWYSVSGVFMRWPFICACLLMQLIDLKQYLFILVVCAQAHIDHLLSNVDLHRMLLLLAESLSNDCCHKHTACLLYASVVLESERLQLLEACTQFRKVE